MSLKGIKAMMECDGCGETFDVYLDPAQEVKGAALSEVVDEEIRFDISLSIQDELQLCSRCTRVADNLGPEDYQPTRDEILKAVGAIG